MEINHGTLPLLQTQQNLSTFLQNMIGIKIVVDKIHGKVRQ